MNVEKVKIVMKAFCTKEGGKFEDFEEGLTYCEIKKNGDEILYEYLKNAKNAFWVYGTRVVEEIPRPVILKGKAFEYGTFVSDHAVKLTKDQLAHRLRGVVGKYAENYYCESTYFPFREPDKVFVVCALKFSLGDRNLESDEVVKILRSAKENIEKWLDDAEDEYTEFTSKLIEISKLFGGEV